MGIPHIIFQSQLRYSLLGLRITFLLSKLKKNLGYLEKTSKSMQKNNWWHIERKNWQATVQKWRRVETDGMNGHKLRVTSPCVQAPQCLLQLRGHSCPRLAVKQKRARGGHSGPVFTFNLKTNKELNKASDTQINSVASCILIMRLIQRCLRRFSSHPL